VFPAFCFGETALPTGTITLSIALKQHDFGTGKLGNLIKLALTYALGINFQIATLNSDYAETGLLFTLVRPATLSYKYLHN